MMYTEVSKSTVLNVKQLTADIQLFIKGIDAGLLPSHVYPVERIKTEVSLDETLLGSTII